MIRVGNYINLVVTLLFWLGVSFQTPLVMFFLSKIRVITPRTLAKQRRFAIVVAFILGRSLVARSFGRIVQEIRRTTSDLPSLMALDEPIDQPPKSQAGGTGQKSESDTQEEGSGER